jgi:hypothetical protein
MTLFRRLFDRCADALIARASRRLPDFVIGGHENPYLLRWWLIPRNPVFNVYLHKFLRDDDDRALHDHPWLWCSVLLRGEYIEVTTPRFEFEGDADDGIVRVDSAIPKGATVHASYAIGGASLTLLMRQPFARGSVRFHRPRFAHRIELLPCWLGPDDIDMPPRDQRDDMNLRAPCWTLFITGPRVRSWGFHCPGGWVPWQRFTAPDDAGAIGPGCGEP